jgi:hypothetical protein
MFESIFKVNQQKIAKEKQLGKKYDVVIRLRTDILFHNISKHFKEYDMKNTVYTSEKNCHLEYGINDMFSFGSSESMDIYCETYHVLPNIVSEGCAINPECLLGFTLKRKNVQVSLIDFAITLLRKL